MDTFTTTNPTNIEAWIEAHSKPVSEDRTWKHLFHERASQVYFLDEDAAAEIWRARIDGQARHHFELPDDCWIIQAEWEYVGSFVRDDCDLSDAEMQPVLRSAVSFEPSTWCAYLTHRDSALVGRWETLSRYFTDLHEWFSEVPYIVELTPKRGQMLMFQPHGKIYRHTPATAL